MGAVIDILSSPFQAFKACLWIPLPSVITEALHGTGGLENWYLYDIHMLAHLELHSNAHGAHPTASSGTLCCLSGFESILVDEFPYIWSLGVIVMEEMQNKFSPEVCNTNIFLLLADGVGHGRACGEVLQGPEHSSTCAL